MENQTFTPISNPSVLANNSASADANTPNRTYSEENRSPTRIITQPTVNKLASETIKQEELENTSLQQDYSNDHRAKTTTHRLPPTSTGVTSVHLSPSETVNGLRLVPMTNVGSHLISNLNPVRLSDASGPYFVPAMSLTDLASNYKLPPSSNSDLPSPSSSSNSSNPHSSTQQQHNSTRRHGEGGDPTRKRQMRLQKNREAARECRRKKKEYIKCLEERVNGLENQNKALIEELRQLKELYCQRDETSHKNSNNNNKTTTVTTSTR